MPAFSQLPPLSLYIHTPWCIKKCPYCDFNSHALKTELPEQDYINALLEDFKKDLPYVQNRKIQSIFIGGGTPSLFSAKAYETLFQGLQNHLKFADNIEITLEANPGTVEQTRFQDYLSIGINRLSMGIQSFNNTHLKILGRIHSSIEAQKAIDAAINAGFENFNLDLMHGLPQQTLENALDDLKIAISFNPSHLSWYQLTIEPNTLFYHKSPTLPAEETLWDIQTAGYDLLNQNQFKQYEISAFCKTKMCEHNRNYWLFGDYLGIGAGAHGKITLLEHNEIIRLSKVKHPKAYLDPNTDFIQQKISISESERPLEFLMNAFRLFEPIEFIFFEHRTGLSRNGLTQQFNLLKQKELMNFDEKTFQLTPLGYRFLNSVLESF